jgi:hypothetical protein
MAEQNIILKDSKNNILYPQIANSSVTSSKLANGSVTKEKLAKTVSVDKMTSTTWLALKALKAGRQLIPGMQYRITDYNCTTTQDDTRSAGHQFDIIVTADSIDTLNEEARAVPHSGNSYFANSKLSAWRLWYCLDNDTNRFGWADSANGKGVIYRMIDEFGNDCPYDFKNIQFRRYLVTSVKYATEIALDKAYGLEIVNSMTVNNGMGIWCYTFNKYSSSTSSDATITERSPFPGYEDIGKSDKYHGVQGNVIKPKTNSVVVDSTKEYIIWELNNIVFLAVDADAEFCYNKFDSQCYDITILNYSSCNTFGRNCYSNMLWDQCSFNSFHDDCSRNILGTSCLYNKIDSGIGNILDNRCYHNTLENTSRNNVFLTGCEYNYLHRCEGNILKEHCSHNVFGSDVSYITMGSFYRYNHFDEGVSGIKLAANGTKNNYVQNYHIRRGMIFTTSNMYTLNLIPGKPFETIVARKSSGAVIQYCEADSH